MRALCLLLCAALAGCREESASQSSASQSLVAACSQAESDASRSPVPDDVDPGGGGSAAQLLDQLSSPDEAIRDRAALRILRHAPSWSDALLNRAIVVVADAGDWRADPALVRILRNELPSSSRAFAGDVRANAAFALGRITELPRGIPPNPGQADDHARPQANAPLPEYVYRAVLVAACPPAEIPVRQAATRALGQFRDARAAELLRLIIASPSTGDDVQDELLRFTAARSLTMIFDENAVSADVAAASRDAARVLRESIEEGSAP